MKYKFHWTFHIIDADRKSAEESIHKDLESGHIPIDVCHEGAGIVTLSSSHPLQTTLVGNMKCSCGKILVTICGSSDGSGMSYQPVEN